MSIKTNLIEQGFFIPTKALLVYNLDTKSDFNYGSGTPAECYVSIHSIRGGTVCEGHPVNKRDILELCKLVMPKIGQFVYIPEKLLAYSPANRYGSMIWWMPSGTKTILFHDEKMKSGPAPVPATLFAVNQGRLHVWALKRNKRPTPDTPLYHAPYFNTFSDGACMGNVKTPKYAEPSSIVKWEQLYFESAFTSEGEPELLGTSGEKLWSMLTKGDLNKFPNHFLKKWGTLKDVMKKVGGRS